MKNKLNIPFLKSITALASGSIIAQIITFIASPIMTRLYTSEEIGVYTLILTTVSMFGGVICGRYDISIVFEQEEDKVLPIIKLSLIISILASSIISLGYGVYYWLSGKENQSYLVVVVFTLILLFTTGIGNILISYNNRKREYPLMTSVNIIRAIGKNLTIVILGLLKTGSIGILISETVAQVLGTNIQLKSLKPHFKELFKVSKQEMALVAKKHYRQPVYSVPAIFANSFSYSSINFFIESLFGLSVLGYYSMSFRVLGLPLSVISNNVSKVFFEEASREYNETKQFKKSFCKTCLFLIVISVPMVLSMLFLAPPLFGWIFGHEWKVSGYYVKVLAPMFGIRFIVSALTPGMVICGKQKYELFIQILFALMSVVGYITTKSAHLTINQYLIIISLSFFAIYIIYFLTLLTYSKGSIKRFDV